MMGSILHDYHEIARRIRLTPLEEGEKDQLNFLAREMVEFTAAESPKPRGPVLETCPPAQTALICVPAYDGKPNIELMTSILASQGVSCRFGFYGVSREVYVDRARNALVTDFLNSDSTDLIFWDADVGCDPLALMKLCRAERPFVAGVYPKKGIDHLDFPLDFMPGTVTSDHQGLIEMAMVPTGFLRLHRSVFEAMPYTPYHDMGKDIKGYFKTQIAGGAFIGEDVAFCHVWRAMGGRIWVEPDIDFQHIGWKTWTGNLKKWILESGKGVVKDGGETPRVQGSPSEYSPGEGTGREEDWIRIRRRYLGLEDERGVGESEERESQAA